MPVQETQMPPKCSSEITFPCVRVFSAENNELYCPSLRPSWKLPCIEGGFPHMKSCQIKTPHVLSRKNSYPTVLCLWGPSSSSLTDNHPVLTRPLLELLASLGCPLHLPSPMQTPSFQGSAAVVPPLICYQTGQLSAALPTSLSQDDHIREKDVT